MNQVYRQNRQGPKIDNAECVTSHQAKLSIKILLLQYVMSLDDPLLFQAMCAVLEQMDRSFPANGSLSLVSGVMVCFGLSIFVMFQFNMITRALFPRRLGSPSAWSARLVLAGAVSYTHLTLPTICSV